MMRVDLVPGSMGLTGLCCELLSPSQVIANGWMQPVTLTGVTQGDVETIIELAAEKGVTLNYKVIDASQ